MFNFFAGEHFILQVNTMFIAWEVGRLDLPAVAHVFADLLLKFKHTQHHKGEKFPNEKPAH